MSELIAKPVSFWEKYPKHLASLKKFSQIGFSLSGSLAYISNCLIEPLEQWYSSNTNIFALIATCILSVRFRDAVTKPNPLPSSKEETFLWKQNLRLMKSKKTIPTILAIWLSALRLLGTTRHWFCFMFHVLFRLSPWVQKWALGWK